MIHLPTDSAPSLIVKVFSVLLAAVGLSTIVVALYKLWLFEYGHEGRKFDLEIAWPTFKRFAPSLRSARGAWLDYAGGKYRWRMVVFTDAWIEEHLR
jgi:hypothetical protein